MAHIPKPTSGQPILGKRIEAGKVTYQTYSPIGAKHMKSFGFKQCDYDEEIAAQKAKKPAAKAPAKKKAEPKKEVLDFEKIIEQIKEGNDDVTVNELRAVIEEKKLKINKSQPRPALMKAVKAALK